MMLKKISKWVKEDWPSPTVPLVTLSCKQAEDQLSFLETRNGWWMNARAGILARFLFKNKNLIYEKVFLSNISYLQQKDQKGVRR